MVNVSDPPSYSSEFRVYPEEILSKHPVKRLHQKAGSCVSSHPKAIGRMVLMLMFVGYTIYFVFAVRYNAESARALIVLTALFVFCVVYCFIRDHFGNTIYKYCIGPVERALRKNWSWLRWFVLPGILIAFIVYMSLSVIKEARQLQSLSGIVFFFFLEHITSKHPDKVRWRPVVWGFAMQFVMAIIVLRWKPGYEAIRWLSEQISTFIEYGYDGAAAIFGDPFLMLHPFVFMAMPLLVYVGAVMGILYYLGVTQAVAGKLAWLLQSTMGTTAIETLGVAGNIFLNGMDIMLMLRHYLTKLTKSEFHCFLVGNHATVAGFAFAIFVLFGAPPQHLLSAAVMSAPATIAITKLNYPETEESNTERQEDLELVDSEETNVIEAGANGATVAGSTVVAVVVNFIAFLGLLAFINATLSWAGGRVGFPELSFEVICSYLFWPLAFLIGIEVPYCREVAKLIGIKVFTSEILAYQELGQSLKGPLADSVSPRSAAIATYALCGFSGLSTLAIAVGVWNFLCPSKIKEMTSQMWRAIINANISCFFTACVAGQFNNRVTNAGNTHCFISGLMYDPSVMDEVSGPSNLANFLNWVLALIPGYKDLMGLIL
ncbi:hypothetical protein CAPTEDRAFT_123339 [Capitella teleta]|uniref:Sodium/nucleoside cotransporter n=1 Tax=Capitella teleta TaxID=283909 RepID=R7V105_CAPTE|nr:hypothetical protein CAPTEDRAFT_123339 [Capitella teleta]|eukprot:ELU12189.1 hypothetical protein CAPTEDRAFT_123339 [Capitella teleta]